MTRLSLSSTTLRCVHRNDPGSLQIRSRTWRDLMKCSKCGLENRPQARFCKECGQALGVPAIRQTPPSSSRAICSACGATAKPDALFCPRCGQPLSPPLASPIPAPTRQMKPGTDAQSPAPSAAQPSPPSPPSEHTPTQIQPPSATVPEARERRFPRWVPWVVVLVALACLAIVIATVVLLGSSLLSSYPTPPQMADGARSLATSPDLVIPTPVMWTEDWLAPLVERK
jgi:hypothetical protein